MIAYTKEMKNSRMTLNRDQSLWHDSLHQSCINWMILKLRLVASFQVKAICLVSFYYFILGWDWKYAHHWNSWPNVMNLKDTFVYKWSLWHNSNCLLHSEATCTNKGTTLLIHSKECLLIKVNYKINKRVILSIKFSIV